MDLKSDPGREEMILTPPVENSPERAKPRSPDTGSAPEEAPGASSSRSRPRGRRLLDGRGWTITSLASDALFLVLAVVSAVVGAGAAGVSDTGQTLTWLLFPPIVIGLLALRGMYRRKLTLRILDEAGHVVGACSVAAMVLIALVGFTSDAGGHAQFVARVWVFAILYVGGSRLMLGLTQRRARAARIVGQPTLIVGAGRIGAQVERRLEDQPELGLIPVGYVDSQPPPAEQVGGRHLAVLGGTEELAAIAHRTGAQHVVLAFLSSRGSDATLVPLVRECDELGLEVSLVPRLFESINVRMGLEHIGGMPLFRLHAVRPRGWHFAVKYALDRVVAGLLTLVLLPVFAALVLAVRLSSPGPIFFRQRRVGRDG
ncbi:MAG: hypothetical protein QOE08_2342, partial [Thermoleophilaceae bacterium]|nr:hypothetical protein [Thermoleophilaceae bacterium]